MLSLCTDGVTADQRVNAASDLLPSTAKKSVAVRVTTQNPFKLVACDMDGTLLNSSHNISDVTRRVISQLLSRGVHVIFATGRPFTDVNRIKRRLNMFANTERIPTPGVQVITPVGSPTSARQGSVSSDMISAANTHSPTFPSSDKVVPRCFAITSNGACIYDEVNRRVYEQTIHEEGCRELYKMFVNDPDVNINIFRSVDEEQRKQKGYCNYSDCGDDKAQEEWVSRYPSHIEAALYAQSHFTFKVVPDLEKTFSTRRVNEIFFLCYDPVKAMKVEKAINTRMQELQEEKNLPPLVRVAPSASHCLDVMPANVSKASALEYVVEQLGIKMSDCIAFGDGLNDVEMLRAVGKACVMENANPRLKKILPDVEVIGSNDDDGVAKKLIEVFGLDLDARE